MNTKSMIATIGPISRAGNTPDTPTIKLAINVIKKITMFADWNALCKDVIFFSSLTYNSLSKINALIFYHIFFPPLFIL